MTLKQILEQDGLEDRSKPQYNEREIIDAFTSDEPYVNMKKVFDRDFFPKIIRWIESKVEHIETQKKADKLVGGELKAKLDEYLEIKKGQQRYESNAEMLTRELLNDIDKWNDFEIKPKDIPNTGL